MQRIQDIINVLETQAPLYLQESYDNSGLVCGDRDQVCSGAITALDLTEEVIDEAILRKQNLIIVHHPPIFSPIKSIVKGNAVANLLIKAIRNNISVYACHTNLDNVLWGVNGEIANRIGLINRQVLLPKADTHKKIITFVPSSHLDKVKDALFLAGAGKIGQYEECSFNVAGQGNFKPLEDATPYSGEKGKRHTADEERLEVIFPTHLQSSIINALLNNHPYEVPAYDILSLDNQFREFGGGVIGKLPEPVTEIELLTLLKSTFNTGVIRHSELTNKPIQTIAVCGGSGKSMIYSALSMKADVFITADLTYHDFFSPNGKILLADIGHFESEQYTSDLLERLIKEKFPTFAVQKTGINTNPVNYFL
ncbi:MAG: Nif3-like dinuclear metal center hexameric protein [bacterium]